MTFPDTKLDLWAELEINGTWHNISGDVRSPDGTDAITITRGISSSGGLIADPGTCALTLDNNSGDYSARNPLSPYYPYLGLNTPIRVGAAYGAPWLDCPYGQHQSASTPDTAALAVTDLDVRADIEAVLWGDYLASDSLIAAKADGGDLSWKLSLTGGGSLDLTWTTTGGATLFVDSDALPLAPNTRKCVRATLDTNNGSSGYTATFYTADTLDGTWTQLGDAVVGTGTTSIATTTTPLYVGAPSVLDEAELARKVYAVQVLDSIDGTPVADVDFEAQAIGATSFTDDAGLTWTADTGAVTNRFLRFSGEVSEWPPQWTTGGQDVTTPIRATGLLQRYGQAKNALLSPLRRRITADEPLAYWPMEDGPTATRAASGLVGGAPLLMGSAAPKFAETAGPSGSLALPDFSNGGTLRGQVRGGVSNSWSLECLVLFPTDLPAGFAAAIGWNALGSRANVWELDASPAADGGLNIQWANTDFDDFGGPYYSDVGVNDGLWHHISVIVAQSGTAISIEVWLDGEQVIDETEASVTLGSVRQVNVNGLAAADAGVPSVGHLAIWSPAATTFTDEAVNAYDGDLMEDRLNRLFRDEATPLSVAALEGETEQVGPEPIGTLLTIITDTVRADEGLLYETRERLGLRARGRSTLYSQESALDLPYVAAPQPLMAPLTPVGDLQGRLNDSTVTRPNGSSGRYQVSEGRLSVQEPPLGIGSGYDENVTLNLYTDGQTLPHAAWRTYLGTVDADRFPQVNIELAKAPSLIPAVCRLDTGSRMRITPPLLDQLPPDAIDQLVLGYTEVLAQKSWRLSLSCQPYAPFLIGIVEDGTFGRADTTDCQLGADVDADDTSLSLVTAAGGARWIDSATYAAEFPFDLLLGGERVTVTAITGTTTTQTATVTRAVNGISRGWDAGATVTLANPAFVAL